MSHRINTPRQVLLASLAGTTIEYFDFYIYANAAVLVFPKLFFPSTDPNTATLASLATFAIAFLARPIGSALFGHFGDRIGRKATLVAALSTMGIATVIIGLLPTYNTLGIAAPICLAICRFGQGLGLGGEWGGAVLLAIENAPPNRRVWYGIFPQLGAPVGLFLSGAVYLFLSRVFNEAQFFSFGWRLPFIASASLVAIGLYVRLSITETPVFAAAKQISAPVRLPMARVFTAHLPALIITTSIGLSAFVLFYLMSVFTLTWGTTVLAFPRSQFLLMQLFSIPTFAITIPISAWLATHGRKRFMFGITAAIFIFGFCLAPLFTVSATGAVATMAIGFALMGLTYGPLGTMISEAFPTSVRYSGSSLAFSFTAILGGSLAPSISLWLAKNYSLQAVGYYLSASALVSFIALLLVHENKDAELQH
jgi:MFS family permease